MHRITPRRKAMFGPRIEGSKVDDRKWQDFPAPSKYIQPEEAISQEDILLYENYILEELDNLEKKFSEIHSDILFLKTITSDALRTNKSYLALEKLFLKTQQQQREIEELTKFLQDFRDKKNFIFEDRLREFDYLVNFYKIQLQQDKENFEELSKEIKKINESMDVTKKNARSNVKKEEIASTNSLTTSDINDEDLEKYFFDFFLKIEESREKLKILQSELEDFCQQQSYQELVNFNDPNNDKIQKKTELIIATKDRQYKIIQNLEIIDKYELEFNELVKSIKFPEALTQSYLMMSKLNSFCLELEGFFASYSLDNFRTQLDSLSSNAIEISSLPKIATQSLPVILERETLSGSTINSQSSRAFDPLNLSTDSPEIETINPIKLFQEVLKNLLDKNQQSANSIIVLGQEVSSNYSLFEKLKCYSLKGVDEDEQPTISYFLIKNKLVKLTYNSQDLINSSEPNSGNLNHQNGDQFSRFSSEEILEKLNELENLKLRFIKSRASNHQDSPQNPLTELSQSFLNNFKIEIVEIEDLRKNQSIPKSIKKEVNKLPKSTPNISASIGCFQALNRGSKKQLDL